MNKQTLCDHHKNKKKKQSVENKQCNNTEMNQQRQTLKKIKER